MAGYKIYQIPKKIYDKNEERYIDYVQREFMISDRELRYKAELESICKNYGVEERKRFARCKVKVDRYDFVN